MVVPLNDVNRSPHSDVEYPRVFVSVDGREGLIIAHGVGVIPPPLELVDVSTYTIVCAKS